MRQHKITMAPMEEIIHFLAVFQRAFMAIHYASEKGDREEMLLGGGLADTLHNIPSHLLYHDPSGLRWIDSRPTVFPQRVQKHAPERIAALCATIFSSDHDAGDLGLKPGLNDLDLAPPEKLDEYLHILYRACLGMRLMSNFGNGPPVWLNPNEKWSKKADEYGAFNGQLAHLLLPIPMGLAHWRHFDEKAFWRDARRLWRHLPYRYHTRWEAYFHKRQNWWSFVPERIRDWSRYQLSRVCLLMAQGTKR